PPVLRAGVEPDPTASPDPGSAGLSGPAGADGRPQHDPAQPGAVVAAASARLRPHLSGRRAEPPAPPPPDRRSRPAPGPRRRGRARRVRPPGAGRRYRPRLTAYCRRSLTLTLALGGTKLPPGRVDGDGGLVHHTHAASPGGDAEAVWTVLAGLIDDALTRAGGRVRAVGVGSAGPIDLTAGTVSPINLTAWSRF